MLLAVPWTSGGRVSRTLFFLRIMQGPPGRDSRSISEKTIWAKGRMCPFYKALKVSPVCSHSSSSFLHPLSFSVPSEI